MRDPAGPDDPEFRTLIEEAEARPVAGWDFSWLGARLITSSLPWDYDAIALRHARDASDMLDMGTGGGEWLAAFPGRPPRTVATEGWEPNVDVAGARLRPLGVTVVSVEAAPDNVDQEPDERRGRLPFPEQSFDLVLNRHESFVASEVARILAPSGRFLTEQVGTAAGAFQRLLGLPIPPQPPHTWNLATAIEQVERAGLRVVCGDEGEQQLSFSDVGALAWYLKAIPWEVQGFSPLRDGARLAALHRRIEAEGAVAVRLSAFWVEADKHGEG